MLTRLMLLAVLFAMPVLTQEPKIRRLESLTWNPVENKLTWAVSNGTRNEKGEYTPGHDQFVYQVDLRDAVMEHNGSRRRFSKEEASNVMVVMGLISKYAQESVMWWDAGKGDAVGGKDEKVQTPPAPPKRNWTVHTYVASK